MSTMDDDKPRMTAAEADARFEALVAQHRSGQAPRTPRGPRISRLTPMTALMLVYIVGVVTGSYEHAKPLVAVVVGLPLLLVCRAWLKRSGHLES
jgi:hypothetical protein